MLKTNFNAARLEGLHQPLVNNMRNLSSKLAIPLLSLPLIMPGVSEAAPSAGAKARFPVRPTNIPADYVPTPFGLYVSSKCVIVLGPGDRGIHGRPPRGARRATLFGPISK